ncbi:MAG: glycosyltransferase family 9 protein [Bacteroidales bacterium]|nr:glycosyltransferase family 9 protein [Bacteroidales bacterium]
MVKFLIIRFSSIGDIVLTSPVARCLKNQLEEARIHYLVKQKFGALVSANPFIDKVHLFENDLDKTIKELKSENFDYIIDLHNNMRSSLVKLRIRAIPFSFHKQNFNKWLLVHLKINRLPGISIVDRYLDPLKSFGVVNDGKGLDFFIPKKDIVNTVSFPVTFRKGFIVFAIGANHVTKRMPVEKIIGLIKNINLPVILLGDENDKIQGDKIVSAAGNNVLNACGLYNINQSASIVKQSKVVISHDTGLMHIAAAFGKKIISIWGNTVPEFGMYPYQPDPDSRIIQVENLKCRPCSKLGFKKCPKKHFRCMNDINTEQVARLVRELFQKDVESREKNTLI